MTLSVSDRFCVSIVTAETSEAFYNLIQEQAEQHASKRKGSVSTTAKHAAQLYRTAIQERGIEAFLVHRKDTNQAVAAVTYIPCHTELGAGLYLEDIVTTKTARKQGIGGFAMAALAQITLHHGFSYLGWECALNNHDAQKFYTDLGAERYDDRHTWRYAGAVPVTASIGGDTGRYTVRELEQRDVPTAVAMMKDDGAQSSEPHLRTWLSGQLKRDAETPIFLVAQDNKTQTLAGFAYGYRSYSTFRTISGLHIESMHVKQNQEIIAPLLLQGFGHIQSLHDWKGHADFTLRDAQKEIFEPIVKKMKFKLLSYGEDKMVVRRLRNTSAALALTQLANTYPNIDGIADVMVDAPHRPRPQNRFNPLTSSILSHVKG